MINNILSPELSEALGWTVLHSFWQAAVIAALLFTGFTVFNKMSAKLRYRLSGLALLSVLLTAVGTFIFYYETGTAELPEVSLTNPDEALPILIKISEKSKVETFFGGYFAEHLPMITAAWLVGLSVFLIRLLGGWAYVSYIKNNKIQAINDFWQGKADALRAKIPLRIGVPVFESRAVKSPVTIGWLKPVVLMPIGLVNQLSVEQTEAILAHELAHIARQDYLFNLLQSFIETLFYFNPAVWLLSAQIRRERENCCDDIALRVCGNRLEYVKALVSVEEANIGGARPALAFSDKKGNLLSRVQRILQQPQKKSRTTEKLLSASLIFAALFLFAFKADSAVLTEDNTGELLTPDRKVTVITLEEEVLTDTIPEKKKSISKIEKKTDDEKISMRIENDEIVKLYIDGKLIPKEDYPKYEDKIAEIIENYPPPPPAPPAAPNIESISPPPAPGGNDFPPPPPPPALAPPAAPQAPEGMGEGASIIREDGNIFVYKADSEMEENIEVLVEESETLQTEAYEMQKYLEEQGENLTNLQADEIIILQEKAKAMADEVILQAEDLAALAEYKEELIEQRAIALENAAKAADANEMVDDLEKQLIKDGLYNKGVYRLKITNKHLKINGKRQSDAMYQKYKSICAKHQKGLGTSYAFEIKRSGENRSTSVQ